MNASESGDRFDPSGVSRIGEGRKVRAPQGKVVASGNCPVCRDKESATEKKTPQENFCGKAETVV